MIANEKTIRFANWLWNTIHFQVILNCWNQLWVTILMVHSILFISALVKAKLNVYFHSSFVLCGILFLTEHGYPFNYWGRKFSSYIFQLLCKKLWESITSILDFHGLFSLKKGWNISKFIGSVSSLNSQIKLMLSQKKTAVIVIWALYIFIFVVDKVYPFLLYVAF